MIDKKVNKFLNPYLSLISNILLKIGISANHVTYFGLFLVPVIIILILIDHTYLAIIFIILNRLCDGLDGNLARINKTTKFGGFLDIIADCIFYVSIPLGFALLSKSNSFPTIILLISYIINLSSFLGLAAIKNISERELKNEKKSFYYSFGIIEGAETFLFYLIVCIFPSQYSLLAYIFSFLVFVTSLKRILSFKKSFS